MDISANQLDDIDVLWGLSPGDRIVSDSGQVLDHLLVIKHGFVFDQGNGFVEIVYAPAKTIRKIYLPIDAVVSSADWLKVRQ